MIALTASAATADRERGVYNVREFGAVGDGVADDTEALRRCVRAMNAARPGKLRFVAEPDWDLNESPIPAMVFPKGVYRVTDRVEFDGSFVLQGEAGATIFCPDPTKEVFYARKALRFVVQGLTFDGGGSQLRQWTDNQDHSYYHVADCVFKNAAGYAIQGTSFKSTRPEMKGIGVETPWNSEADTEPVNNSTLIIVERCRFENNRIAAWLYSDGTAIRDCTFIAPPAAATPQIVAGSSGRLGVELYYRKLHIEYPAGATGDPGAIRFEGGRLNVEDSTIVSTSPLSAVRAVSYLNHYHVPTQAELRDLRLRTGPAPVVKFAAGCSMNRLSEYEFTSLDGARHRLVDFDRIPTDAEIDDRIKNGRGMRDMPGEHAVGLAFRGCDPKHFDDTLPPSVARYRREAPNPAWKRPLPAWFPETFAAQLPTGRLIRVPGSLGYPQPDAGADDTEALARILAEAKAQGGGIVELPARWFVVSRPLVVPDGVRLTCRGFAAFIGKRMDQPVFTAEPGSRVGFERIVVGRGRNVFAGAPAQAVFCDVISGGQASHAFEVHSVAPLASRLLVTAGCIISPYLYRGNADAMLDNLWFEMMPERAWGERRSDFTSVVNEPGGQLRFREILGVPCYFLNYPRLDFYAFRVRTGSIEGRYRWVDNFGRLESVNVRYGGEWCGQTPVYHCGAAAQTYLEGGNVELQTRYCLGGKAIVIADRPDADVTMIDTTGTVRTYPFRAAWVDGRGEYHVLESAKCAMNYLFSPWAPVWPRQPFAQGGKCRFVGRFTCPQVPAAARLELECPLAAKVYLNGRLAGETHGNAEAEKTPVAPRGLMVKESVELHPTAGENEITVETDSAAGYFLASVIADEHAILESGLTGNRFQAFDDAGRELELAERHVVPRTTW